MRRVFATQPIGQIVTRICTALNIPTTATLWPTDLVAITQTPAEWSAALHEPAPAPVSSWPAVEPDSRPALEAGAVEVPRRPPK